VAGMAVSCFISLIHFSFRPLGSCSPKLLQRSHRRAWVRFAKVLMKLCRVGKGGGTSTPYVEASRAPCPRVTDRSRSYDNAWARRTIGLAMDESSCHRLCPPYDPALLVSFC